MSESKNAQWNAKLAASRHELLTFLTGLQPAQWTTTVFSEGDSWTIKTVVSHLLDSERGMSIQVHKIRKGEETIPHDFDLARWNAGVAKRVGDLSPAELMAGLEATRAKTLELLDKVEDREWELTGRHPARGVITIDQYYETIHGHELIHTADMRKAVGQ
ncbi:MAG: DinB family protein [Caldilineaceae bacterium]